MADIKTHLRELSVATTVGLLKQEIQFKKEDLYNSKKFMEYAREVISGDISSANNIEDVSIFSGELRTIIDNGYDYDVDIEIGNFSFPTKTYGDISIPAGQYDALRVKIGKAEGQNWWCVMFPPLCFVNVSSGIVPAESKKILENELDDEEYSIISETENKEVKFKFKIIELLQNTNILTAKK